MARRHRWPLSVHPVLDSEIGVTTSLEHATKLKRPWDLGGGSEEPEHLHRVSGEPRNQDGEAETFAGARAAVGEDLWDG